MADDPASKSRDSATELEAEKFILEKARYRTDLLKGVLIATGAVISFAVIDHGKLKLEQFRVASENQRELLSAYLRATESPDPEVWKRKLNLIINSPSDESAKKWARRELVHINNFAELDSLYRETLKVASQLVDPKQLNERNRISARARYEQLYWADLPYANESEKVELAMIAFRGELIEAESNPSAIDKWETLNNYLIELSIALRESTPKPPDNTHHNPDSVIKSKLREL
ncbi:hypothetical protein D3C76_898400 [compost metagenome]